MEKYIYADNAATTRLDDDAFNAMKPYLLQEYGNASQPYSFSRNVKSAIKDARCTIAECINANEDEIFFTSGGTESDNWAIKGCNAAKGGTTITSAIEHHAILNACKDIEKDGCCVKYLKVDNEGKVHAQTLRDAITGDTSLVSIMFANNEIGTIQDIEELAKITHEKGANFHSDAVQALGHVKIDVKELGVDMLSASAHKFNGPKGVGFLYIKKGTEIARFISGGMQENGMRAGTENTAAIVGMAAALKKNCSVIDETEKKLHKLEEALIGGLRNNNIDFVRNGDDKRIPGNISLSFPGEDGEAILHRMDLNGIAISTGSACDSKNTNISHVLQAIGLDENLAHGTIRISLGKYNTQDDVEKIVAALTKIIK